MQIVNIPFLHKTLSTYALLLMEWLIVGRLAVTIVPILEMAKWMESKGWFGEVE